MHDVFPRTQWSRILAAGEGQADALNELCGQYWEPLYVYARRRGGDVQTAQDSVQSFLTRFVTRNDFARADPDRGRFRAYLLGAFKNHLASEHARRTAEKRGGGVADLPLSFEDAEGRLRNEPVDPKTPEDAFTRRWAQRLIEEATEDVGARYADRHALFDALRGTLTGEPVEPYAVIGEELGMSVGAVKVAVHRLRKAFQQAFKARVLETVADPNAVESEIRTLLDALQ